MSAAPDGAGGHPESGPALPVRLWFRLPVVARAVLGGAFVFLVLQSGCTLLFVANLKLAPAVPWSVPLGLLYLGTAFQYFNGRWKPRSTAAARRDSMRARPLSGHAWRLALAACAATIVFIISTTILSYRLIEIPAEELGLPDTSALSTYSWLVMIAIVAGVSEEAGFRGYMQSALEKRYGSVLAVTVSAVAFWAAHLNHANGAPRIVALCIMGASLGVLALSARSILPAIIAHAMTDAIIFVCGTAGFGPDYLWNPVPLRDTGLDGFFWVTMAALTVAAASGVLFLRKLARITSR